jgi:hypothetical protein
MTNSVAPQFPADDVHRNVDPSPVVDDTSMWTDGSPDAERRDRLPSKV